MWLRKLTEDLYEVNYRTFIDCQPCRYSQVSEVIEAIDRPVEVMVNLSDLNVSEVDIPSLILLVWELHEETKEKQLLKSILFRGAKPWVMDLWEIVEMFLPTFVSTVVNCSLE